MSGARARRLPAGLRTANKGVLVHVLPRLNRGSTPLLKGREILLLWVWIGLLHDLELDLYPWHRDPNCIVPPWILPSVP